MENDGRRNAKSTVSKVSSVGNTQDFSGFIFDADTIVSGTHVPISAFDAVFWTFVVAFFAGFVAIETSVTSTEIVAELV